MKSVGQLLAVMLLEATAFPDQPVMMTSEPSRYEYDAGVVVTGGASQVAVSLEQLPSRGFRKSASRELRLERCPGRPHL